MSEKTENKYIQQNYLLGELQAEKERIQETKRRLVGGDKEGGVDAEAWESICKEERDVKAVIARYEKSSCEVCQSDTVHVTAINYETWGMTEGMNEPTQSSWKRAKYCPECGRKL